MNFKVGDRVRIKDWNELAKEYSINKKGNIELESGESFTASMKVLCGRTATIKKINTPNILLCDWDIDKNENIDILWNYTVEMIEKIKSDDLDKVKEVINNYLQLNWNFIKMKDETTILMDELGTIIAKFDSNDKIIDTLN